jgi:hypothetical protein
MTALQSRGPFQKAARAEFQHVLFSHRKQTAQAKEYFKVLVGDF